VPQPFRQKIVSSYADIKSKYSQAQYTGSWDSAGLGAGKFAEAVFRFLQHTLTGKSLPFGKNIPNFPDECRILITSPQSAGHESLRIIIPRALVLLYTLRGKRGIGHVGGDVEANEIDLGLIVKIADWIVCELIRIFHQLSLEEAQQLVDTLSERTLPDVWSVAGKKRVLRTDLSFRQKTLLLLYGTPTKGVLAEDLYTWVEHSNFSVYKRDVLRSLHKEHKIEYDEHDEIVYVSPTGVEEVETEILS
jgi:hypothetical protein